MLNFGCQSSASKTQYTKSHGHKVAGEKAAVGVVGGRLEEGYLLVESLVSLVIFSIAILGLVATQISASKNNLSALVKTETAINMSEIIDKMRANRAGVVAGEYDLAETDIDDKELYPSGATTLVEGDLESWRESLFNTAHGMSPKAEIACTNLDCTISISWSDSRAINTDDTGDTAEQKAARRFKFVTQVNF